MTQGLLERVLGAQDGKRLAKFAKAVIGLCFDFGTESQFAEACERPKGKEAGAMAHGIIIRSLMFI